MLTVGTSLKLTQSVEQRYSATEGKLESRFGAVAYESFRRPKSRQCTNWSARATWVRVLAPPVSAARIPSRGFEEPRENCAPDLLVASARLAVVVRRIAGLAAALSGIARVITVHVVAVAIITLASSAGVVAIIAGAVIAGAIIAWAITARAVIAWAVIAWSVTAWAIIAWAVIAWAVIAWAIIAWAVTAWAIIAWAVTARTITARAIAQVAIVTRARRHHTRGRHVRKRKGKRRTLARGPREDLEKIVTPLQISNEAARDNFTPAKLVERYGARQGLRGTSGLCVGRIAPQDKRGA